MDRSSPQPSESSGLAPRPTFGKEQEAAIFRAAGRRVTAAVLRQPAESTRNLLGQAADTPVYGAFVTLRRAGKLRSCCGHIELPVPLWAALDRAADRAATCGSGGGGAGGGVRERNDAGIGFVPQDSLRGLGKARFARGAGGGGARCASLVGRGVRLAALGIQALEFFEGGW